MLWAAQDARATERRFGAHREKARQKNITFQAITWILINTKTSLPLRLDNQCREHITDCGAHRLRIVRQCGHLGEVWHMHFEASTLLYVKPNINTSSQLKSRVSGNDNRIYTQKNPKRFVI